jgi:stage III sporulation protein AD
MTMASIAVIGLTAVILAVQLKAVKGEYGVYLVLCAGLVIFFYGLSKLEAVMEALKRIQACVRIDGVYLGVLMKMIGITYIAEFASGICRDAGYGSLGAQIEIFGKLSMLAVSMPVLLALMETMKGFLS